MINDINYELFVYKLGIYISKVINKPLVKPQSVYLMLTCRCNLKCKICTIWQYANKNSELKTKKIFDIIDQISSMGINNIHFSGGEPLLRDDIFQILEYSKSKNLMTGLTTNGTLIDEKIAKHLCDCVSHIQLSIDGLEKTHDYIRGSGAFKKTINGITLIKKLRNNKNVPSIGITSCITKYNINELIELTNFFKKLNVNSVIFQPAVTEITNPTRRFSHGFLSKKDQKILEKNIDYLIKCKKSGFVNILSSVNLLNDIKNYFKDNFSTDLECFEGYSQIPITSDGRIKLCDTCLCNLKKVL